MGIKDLRIRSFSLLPYGVLLLTLVTLLYRDFSPPPCTKKVQGPLNSSLIINCDSAQFMQDSRDFGRVLSGISSYQDRPLYTLAGKFFAEFFSIFTNEKRSYPNSMGLSIEFYFSNLLSFQLINVSVLIISLYFLLNGLRRLAVFTQIQLFCFVAIVFFNDLVKGFTWTPHTQVFNILLITYALYSWSRFRTAADEPHSLLWFSSVTLLTFFYPSLLLLILIPLAVSFKSYVAYSLLPLTSYFTYPLLINRFNGTYRNAAVEEFDQFVWIFDIRDLMDVVYRFKLLYVELDKDLLVALALLTILSLYRKKYGHDSPVDKSLLVFIGGYAAFLILIGLYTTRLSTPFLLLLIVVLLIDLRFKLPANFYNFLLCVISSSIAVQFFFFQGSLT